MDKERKLELLVKYDFSKPGNNFETSGIGALLQAFIGAFENIELLTDFEKKINKFNILDESYNQIMKYYSTIDFNELNENDEDFKFLFEYNLQLIELGKHSNKLKEKIKEKENHEIELKRVDDCYSKLEKMNYRDQVLRKYRLNGGD